MIYSSDSPFIRLYHGNCLELLNAIYDKRPGLPEMNGAGDQQTNGQDDLADQTEANQARQEAFGFWIFQWLKGATLRLRCQQLQLFRLRLISARQGGFWHQLKSRKILSRQDAKRVKF